MFAIAILHSKERNIFLSLTALRIPGGLLVLLGSGTYYSHIHRIMPGVEGVVRVNDDHRCAVGGFRSTNACELARVRSNATAPKPRIEQIQAVILHRAGLSGDSTCDKPTEPAITYRLAQTADAETWFRQQR
jgi:hypothetical protein